MIELTEKEWFDKYYPKEWGDWRKCYNLKEYRKNEEKSGCSWLNYQITGWVGGENSEELMKIHSYKEHNSCFNFCLNFCLKSSLFSVNETISNLFCAAQQPDGTKWVQAILKKIESNLDLYTIKLFGIDDTSYSKDFISLNKALKGWELLPYVLENSDNLIKENYYFTN